MGWKREHLSPEEREEYDKLITEAGFDDSGAERPSDEIGVRMHELLVDAVQAGRQWAEWIIQDDAEAGHLKRFNAWNKARKKMKVFYNGVIVPKAAVVGVRRKRDDGTAYYQQSIYKELTWAEVEQKLEESLAQRRSAGVNANTYRRLLELRSLCPESIGPTSAAAALGIDLDEYLQGDEGVA